MNNATRIAIEKAIVTRLVEDQAKAGFVPVAVWDGEEYAPWGINHRESRDFLAPHALTVAEAIDAAFAVDESTVHFAPASDLSDWGSRGVFLVGGNGEDIISDYHARNDAFVEAVEATCDSIEELIAAKLSA